MVAFTLFCLLTQASPNVTITTDGATLGEIVKDLSAQSGLPLGVSAKLKREIVIVQAKKVPLRELMDRIAEADGAEWKPSGAGFELGRSRELEKAQAAEEAACRTEAMKKDFDKTVASHLDAQSAQDPSSYLAWSVLQKLGLEAVANIPRGVRVVWTENPNSLQHRLGFSPSPMIQTYIEQCKRANQGASADRAQGAVRMEVSAIATIMNGCDLRVKVRDAQGAVVISGTLELPPNGPDSIEPPAVGTPSGPNDKPLELSETAQMLRQLAHDQMDGHITARPPEFDNVVFHPEKIDPLALFPADVSGAIARRGNRSLVAVIPDFAMLTGIFFGTGKLYETDARRWLNRICVLDESRPGWMVLRPRLQIDARALRTDRVTMGKFYRDARVHGANLADLAAYVAAQPRRYSETISFFYGFFCQPEIVRMCEPDGLGALRVYGALTPEQRAPLEHGQAVPIVFMPAAAKAEMADWVYNGQLFGGGDTNPNAPDPTDAFPNGLTPACKLKVLASPTAEVVPLYNGHEDLDGSPLSASSLGYELANYTLGTNRIKEPISGFWMGQGIGLQFQFDSPQYQLNASLNEHRINRKGNPLTFNDLPKEFRNEVEQTQRQTVQSRQAAPAKPIEAKP